MNDHEIERVAAAIHQLRPDWPAASLRTFITKNLAERPRRDVAVALAWIACEPATAKPARVLGAGPWWKAAAVEGAASNRDPWDPGGCCTVCSLPEDRCRALWADDHAYVSAARHRADVDATGYDTDAIRQALRGDVEPTRDPAPVTRPATTPNPHAAAARAALTKEDA